MELDNFARDYIFLGLRINKHINGYVEHYYGPPKKKRMKVSHQEKLTELHLLRVACLFSPYTLL